MSHILGGKTCLRDLHRHNALLLGGELDNVSVEIGDLFEKVLVTDESFSEADILSDKDYQKEYEGSPNGEGQNKAKDREDPAKHVEVTLVDSELFDVVGDVKDLNETEEKILDDHPDTFKHRGHKSKKPIQKAFHNNPLCLKNFM
jgi:hypothetical protein